MSAAAGPLKSGLLAVASLTLFLGLAEGLSRLWYSPERIRYDGIFEYDRDKVYALKRNLAGGTFEGRPVTTNSFGHRDREIPRRKPANGFRVVALGDSVTFGHGVDAEQAWPERLERRLAERLPGKQVEVVNTAVPGNSPFQEYYDLERALVLEPDVAVLQFVLNDVVEPYRVFRRYGGTGIDYHGVEDLPYVDWLLRQHSAFYLLLKDAVAKARFGALTREGVRQKAVEQEIDLAWSAAADEPENETVEQAWRECLGWMQREVDLCRDRRIAVVLLVTPVEFQLHEPSRRYAQARLAEFAARNGIAFLDLLPALREESDREIAAGAEPREAGRAVWRRYFVDHDHLSPLGHGLVAERLLAPVTAHAP